MTTILIIEDNVEVQLLLKKYLENSRLIVCYSLAEASNYLSSDEVDLVILDLLLPDGNGLSFLSRLCADNNIPKFPVIVISGKNDIESQISCLNSGADDFISKPFNKEDLLARVNSVLRRGPLRHSLEKLTIGNLALNVVQQTAKVFLNNKYLDLSLTPIEFKLLLNFCNHIDTPFSRQDLKEIFWSETYISSRNIDTHICNLRKKLILTSLDIINKRTRGYYLKIVPHKQKMEFTYYSEAPHLPTSKTINYT